MYKSIFVLIQELLNQLITINRFQNKSVCVLCVCVCVCVYIYIYIYILNTYTCKYTQTYIM